MSTTTTPPPSTDADSTPSPSPIPRGISWWGVRTVAVLETRQRIRSTRWKAALIVWVVLVGGVTGLTTLAMRLSDGMSRAETGGYIFGATVFFVLFLGLLVSPTLSATSINGDRQAGTLALVQATTLSAADIAVGKLLAAWGAALAFLAASVPFLAWGAFLGERDALRTLGALAALAFILLMVCAIGLALSSATARTAGSAVLTYVAVAALSVGTLIAFGLTAPFVAQEEEVQVYDWPLSAYESDDEFAWTESECEWRTETMTVVHTERVAWILAGNPFVIVADIASAPGNDPLGTISWAVRTAQEPPSTEYRWCGEYVEEGPPEGYSVWFWGLAVYAVLGAVSLAVAIRRLRVPTAKLARGTRIA